MKVFMLAPYSLALSLTAQTLEIKPLMVDALGWINMEPPITTRHFCFERTVSLSRSNRRARANLPIAPNLLQSLVPSSILEMQA